MRRYALRGILAHKRRLLSTVTAVLLGVAFMAGSLVFTDTMKASLSGAFQDGERSTDVLVRGPVTITTGQGTQHAPVPADLAADLAAVDGVAAVAPRLEGFAQVLGTDGKPVDDLSGGAAPSGAAWAADERLNPFELVDGRAPRGADEVVVDRSTADAADLSVGDRTSVLTGAAPQEMTVVGIATFAGQDNRAGNRTVLFSAATADRLLGGDGRVDGIALLADDGVGPGPAGQAGRGRAARGGPGHHRDGAGRGERQAHQRGRHVLLAVHDGLRGRRAAGGCVHHQQHVLDPGRAADPRARPAPGDRCQCPPGTPVGGPRGAGRRCGRVCARPARRRRRGPRHPGALVGARHHHAGRAAGRRRSLAGDLLRRRCRRDRGVGSAAGPPGRSGGPRRGDARGRCRAGAGLPPPGRHRPGAHCRQWGLGGARHPRRRGSAGAAGCIGRAVRGRHPGAAAGPTGGSAARGAAAARWSGSAGCWLGRTRCATRAGRPPPRRR